MATGCSNHPLFIIASTGLHMDLLRPGLDGSGLPLDWVAFESFT